MPNKIEEVPFLHICACYLTQDILFLSQENINIYFRRRIIYYLTPKVTFHVYLHFDKIPLTEKYFHILFNKYQEFLIFFYYYSIDWRYIPFYIHHTTTKIHSIDLMKMLIRKIEGNSGTNVICVMLTNI